MPSETTPRPSGGVIHDIGYRHYEGARLGRSYARRSLFSQSVRGAYGLGRSAKSKVAPLLLLAIMVLPAAIIVAVAIATGSDKLPLRYTDYAMFLQPVIWIYLAAQAPQAVSRDLRFHTMPLYFSRPIERRDYVDAKFAALAVAMFVFTAAPLVLLYAGALLAKLDFVDQTKGFGQGLVGAALLSALFAGIGLVVAALTPRRGFGVAAIIALLTIPYGAISTVQGIALEQDSTGIIPWLGLGSPPTLIEGIQAVFLGSKPEWPGGYEPSVLTGCVFLAVLLGLIAGCHAVLMRRYRKAGL